MLWCRRVGIFQLGTMTPAPPCSQAFAQRGDYGGEVHRFPALAAVLAASLLMGGCAVGEPIVPTKIAEMVNEQGRERAYDLVWQDIRRFEGALERGEPQSFDDQALIILSRINRLAEGKASAMKSEGFQEILLAAEQEARILTMPERHNRLHETATRLRIAFDAGAFSDAQQHALRALGYARTLGTD